MQQPLISVIIPTFNREKTLFSSIESVLNQSYKNIELIIVDDNSSDGTEKLIKRIKDERVRYIKNSNNKGAAGARNVGIVAAQGNYIAFQDSDDIWLPEKLSEQMQVFEKDEEIAMVYCAFEYNKGNVQYKIPSDHIPKSELEGYIFHSLIKENKVGTVTIIIKKECIYKVGAFNEELKALEDWELALRISKSYKIGFVNKMLVKAIYTDKSVNHNLRNLLNANIFIAENYLRHETSRVLAKELIRDIIYQINEVLTEEEKPQYINRLIPKIIVSKVEYELILEEMKKTKKAKENYNLAVSLLEMEEPYNFFESYFAKEKVNNIAIYGAGRIGKVVTDLLKNCNINLVCVIDQNTYKLKEIKVIHSHDITENIDMILVTVPASFYEIKKELENYTKSKIVNLSDILSLYAN